MLRELRELFLPLGQARAKPASAAPKALGSSPGRPGGGATRTLEPPVRPKRHGMAPLGADLRTLEKYWGTIHKPPASGPTVDLFVDRHTPIAQLAPLIRAAEPGTRVLLIVRSLSAAPPMAAPQSLIGFQRAMAKSWGSFEESKAIFKDAYASATDGCRSLQRQMSNAAQRAVVHRSRSLSMLLVAVTCIPEAL